MLKYPHGTSGDADDRDTMQEWLDLSSSYHCSPGYLHCVYKYPGVWGRAPYQKPATAEGALLRNGCFTIFMRFKWMQKIMEDISGGANVSNQGGWTHYVTRGVAVDNNGAPWAHDDANWDN